MKRISNRSHSDQSHVAPQVHYVSVASEPQIVETEVERIVEVPVDRIVEVEKIVHVEAAPVDLKPMHDRHDRLEQKLQILLNNQKVIVDQVGPELAMQSRALVSLKAQRDVDRKRRLQLILRLKKHRDAQKKLNLQVKLAIGASLALSILSLIIKL